MDDELRELETWIRFQRDVLRRSPEQIADRMAGMAKRLLDLWASSEVDTKLGERFLESVNDLTTRVIRREVYSVLKG